MAEGRLPKRLEQSDSTIFGAGPRGFSFSAQCDVVGPPGKSAPPLRKLLERTFAEQLMGRYNRDRDLRIQRGKARMSAKSIRRRARAALAGKRDPMRALRMIEAEATGILESTGGE
jgi:hypothetical protein